MAAPCWAQLLQSEPLTTGRLVWQLYAILPPIIRISTFYFPACTTCYNPSSGEKGDGAHTPSQVSHLAHPEVSRSNPLV